MGRKLVNWSIGFYILSLWKKTTLLRGADPAPRGRGYFIWGGIYFSVGGRTWSGKRDFIRGRRVHLNNPTRTQGKGPGRYRRETRGGGAGARTPPQWPSPCPGCRTQAPNFPNHFQNEITLIIFTLNLFPILPNQTYFQKKAGRRYVRAFALSMAWRTTNFYQNSDCFEKIHILISDSEYQTRQSWDDARVAENWVISMLNIYA